MNSKETIKDINSAEWQPILIHPLKASSRLAGIYFAIGMVYIILSSYFASLISVSISDMYQIEVLKGLGFIIVTGSLLFVFAFLNFRRLLFKEKELRLQQRVLLASEKRSAASLFASSISHDINNILNVNRFAIDKLKTQALPEQSLKYLEKLEMVHAKLNVLVQELTLATGKHLTNGIEKIDLTETLNQAISLVRFHSKVKNCKLDTFMPPGLSFKGDASLLHRMILNLVINASDATENHGKIWVKLNEEESQIIIEVHDDGPGIPKDLKTKILEPFFTTKPDGSGLGLLSVKLCSDVHQGNVIIDESELGGACFRVILPKSF
jgi:two-component system sensor histidine kinase HydH